MRVLVIGGGGREHALCWKLAQSPKVDRVYCAPGNAGIAAVAECLPVKADDFAGIIAAVRELGIDLTVVGPDNALADGIVDLFNKEGLRIFGPRRNAAILEWSKAFSKEFMKRHGIPTADYRNFADISKAIEYIHHCRLPVVVKADGLALGKGVVICQSREEAEAAVRQMMGDKLFGTAGDQIVIEEYLVGQEISLLAFTDGKAVVPMLPVQDHKQLLDGDQGPNTGGMGTICPVPFVSGELVDQISDQVLRPAVQGMAAEGRGYHGVLYAGLMFTADGPKVLEFNARFGDPETQVLMPMLKSDLLEIIEAVIDQRLSTDLVQWHEGAAVCVVLASGGYPGNYAKGQAIEGLERAAGAEDAIVFHAGTARQGDLVVTSGGRVLGVTGRGTSLDDALARAYRAVEAISFCGRQFRRDIGLRVKKGMD